jgi:hypothetical protein
MMKLPRQRKDFGTTLVFMRESEAVYETLVFFGKV